MPLDQSHSIRCYRTLVCWALAQEHTAAAALSHKHRAPLLQGICLDRPAFANKHIQVKCPESTGWPTWSFSSATDSSRILFSDSSLGFCLVVLSHGKETLVLRHTHKPSHPVAFNNFSFTKEPLEDTVCLPCQEGPIFPGLKSFF